jgi:hypothetical protein
MMDLRASVAVCAALAAMLNGCAVRGSHPLPNSVTTTRNTDYIDLEPGWRLRVVTPILKSGGYQLRTDGQYVGGGLPGSDRKLTVTVAANDFVGYETSYYAVSEGRSGGVQINFSSAEVRQDERIVNQSQPLAQLFHLPGSARHVRLIYLVRVSKADHDMAVAAAGERVDLDPLTRLVQADPANCKKGRRTFCSWIPVGIAVIPERPSPESATNREHWVPVR